MTPSFGARAFAFAHAQATPKPTQNRKPLPEVDALLQQANKLSDAYKYEDALKVDALALAKAIELHDDFGRAKAIQGTGIDYYYQTNYEKAAEYFAKAREAYHSIGDTHDEMGMAGDLAVVKDNSGHPDEAKDLYHQVLDYFMAEHDTLGTANMCLNLAMVDTNTDNYEESMSYAKRAIALYRQLGDHRWESESLTSLGSAQEEMGQTKEALENLELAFSIAKKGSYLTQMAGAASNLVGIYRSRGDLMKALDMDSQALELDRQVRDLRHEGSNLAEMGVTYDMLGQSRLAVDRLQEAIDIERKLGDRLMLATALTNLGVVYHESHFNELAEPPLTEALKIHRETRDRFGMASCLGTLASIHRDRKEYAAAIPMLREAISIFGEIHQEINRANTVDSLGSLYVNDRKYSKGMSCFRQALEIYAKQNNKTYAANTYANMGRADALQGKWADAHQHYRRAVELIEDVRSKLGASSEGKAEFLEQRIGIYHSYVELLVRERNVTAAFELTEKTKGRSLLDILNGGSVSIQQDLTPAERQEEHQLRSKADELNAAMVREGVQNEVGAKKRFAALQTELRHVEVELEAFTTQLFAKHPLLAQKRAAGTVQLSDLAARLPSDTAILEFVNTENPVVFVVTAHGGVAKVRVAPLGIAGDALASETLALRTAASNPTLSPEADTRRLYAALIKPIESDLAGMRRIVVCPDGPLWDVPFAILWNGKYLAERYEVDYAYSATAVNASLLPRTESHPTHSMLVLANPDFGGAQRFGDNSLIPDQRPIETPSRPIETPSRPIETPSRPIETPSRPIETPSRAIETPSRAIETPSRAIETPSRDLSAGMRNGVVDLPGTQREANSIATIFPDADVLTRQGAQASEFVRLAGNYRYLHVASHAFFNDAAPMLSSVLLAKPNSDNGDGGFLTARSIADLKLNADLVVLSACNTARGEKRTGGGIVGLSWALFVAGVPAQIVSQWSVDDQATATLMARFYRNLKSGEPKGVALRHASLSLLDPTIPGNDPKWRHPYYWSPFILLGDWR